MTKEKDPINPEYYGGTDNAYEALRVIEAWNLGFHLGNVVKYIARCGKKDPDTLIQDLKKAKRYLERKIDQLEKLAKT